MLWYDGNNKKRTYSLNTKNTTSIIHHIAIVYDAQRKVYIHMHG